MIVNGIDLDGLGGDVETIHLPDVVPGRTCHIDADFAAYMTSAEGKTPKTWDDMKHNAATLIETLQGLSGAQYVHLHLTPFSSDKGGRHEIALLKEYQGNRKNKEKPRYLHIMREHLAQTWPSTQHQNCEADDGMSAMQYAALEAGNGQLSIIASKDKDLLMVPGLHLDWDTGIIDGTDASIQYKQSAFGRLFIKSTPSGSKSVKGFGWAMFWAQMLTGDTADNIKGLPGIILPGVAKPKLCGAIAAFTILSECKTNMEAFLRVRDLYRAYGERIGFTNWRDGSPVAWNEAFVSEAKLLWMRRVTHDVNDFSRWLTDCVKSERLRQAE